MKAGHSLTCLMITISVLGVYSTTRTVKGRANPAMQTFTTDAPKIVQSVIGAVTAYHRQPTLMRMGGTRYEVNIKFEPRSKPIRKLKTDYPESITRNAEIIGGFCGEVTYKLGDNVHVVSFNTLQMDITWSKHTDYSSYRSLTMSLTTPSGNLVFTHP